MANHIAFIRDGGHTCIAYEVTAKRVLAVAMDSPELALLNVGTEKFYSEWRPIEGYNAQLAADRYLKSYVTIPSNIQYILENIKMNQEVDATKVPAAQAPAAKPAKAAKAKAPAAKPEPKGKAAKAPVKAPAKKDAKAPAAAPKKGKIGSDSTIKLLKGAGERKFQEGSVRGQVFAKIKDGMTVGALVKACAKFAEESQVLGALPPLANHPTNPAISIK